MPEITVSLNNEEARALSDMLKRIGHADVVALSDQTKPNEVELMKRAINRIREGLDGAGYGPQ